jgi:hypothetical protein
LVCKGKKANVELSNSCFLANQVRPARVKFKLTYDTKATMSTSKPTPDAPLKTPNNPGQVSPKTAELQGKVDSLKNVMQSNLDSVLERGDSLQTLAARSSILHHLTLL